MDELRPVTLWLPVIACMSDFFNASGQFAPGTEIYPGSKAKAKQYPCVELKFDSESQLDIQGGNEGLVNVFVDCFTKSDEKEPVKGYELNYAMGLAVCDLLKQMPNEFKSKVGISAKIDIIDTKSDWEQQRPVFQTRTAVSIEWRKRG